MAIQTYSIDKEIAEKFKQQTPDRKTSQKLEELMADYIDEDVSDRKQPIKILDRDVVTRKRRQLVKHITENDWFNKTGPQILNKCRSTGLYQGDSAAHHFKQAKKFLLRFDGAPLTSENNKIVPEEFICMNDGCDASLYLTVLADNDMQCRTCGRRYVI